MENGLTLELMNKLRRIDLSSKRYLPLVIVIIPIAITFSFILILINLINPRSYSFDKIEASEVLESELLAFRGMTYADCLKYVDQDSAINKFVTAKSGKQYQIDIQLMLDGADDRSIQVVGSVDDGRLRAFFPLTKSFVVIPTEV